MIVNVPFPAVALSQKRVVPPSSPLNEAPLLVKVPLAAVEVLKKSTWPRFELLAVPPLVMNVAVPAVALSLNWVKPPMVPLAVPAFVMKVPLPAVDMLKNSMTPNPPPLTALPLFVNEVPVPAVALLVNEICPLLPAASPPTTKFCVIPELLVMPVPLIVSVKLGLAVMVKGFVAAMVKMISLTSVFAEIEIAVVLERSNVAVSADPFGAVAGVQLPSVFQSPDPGLRFHCALPEMARWGVSKRRTVAPKIRIIFFMGLIGKT